MQHKSYISIVDFAQFLALSLCNSMAEDRTPLLSDVSPDALVETKDVCLLIVPIVCIVARHIGHVSS